MRSLPTALLTTVLCLTLLGADKPKPSDWKDLFDGKTLDNWKPSEYGGDAATVENGVLVIPLNERLAGVTYTGGDVPKTNYEVEIEARKITGSDFFCGLTFPVADSHASLIVGGWGGSVCGISNIDGEDANNNPTRKSLKFKKEQWYKIRLRVEPNRLQTWIDDVQVIDADITGKKVDTRPEINPSKPFGLSTFATTAEIKTVRIREMRNAE